MQACALSDYTVGADDFHEFRILGVGGFGSVCAALKKDTGAIYAVKKMDKKLIKAKNRYKSCHVEVESLKAIHSRFICGLHYCYQTPTDVCLVLDLLHGGTLSYLLQQHKKLPERHVCFFAACMVLAYEALHTAGFVYRDMKPANVLLKSNGYCCLTDFGLTAKVASALKGKCGTRGYWAPEMVKGDQYIYSADWWSLGVMLTELITGKKPFKKRLQKFKNLDDKVKIVEAGGVDDAIEERDIEAKLGAATQIDDDGKDSNDEETDDDDDDDAPKAARGARCSSCAEVSVSSAASRHTDALHRRVIGGFEKTVDSNVDAARTESLIHACVYLNERLAPFGAADLVPRLGRLLSVVTFLGGDEIFREGDAASFFAIVLDGALKGQTSGARHTKGTIVGEAGLVVQGSVRSETVVADGVGVLGIVLYSEMGRARLFDGEVADLLSSAVAMASRADAAAVEASEADAAEAAIGDSATRAPPSTEGFIAALAERGRAAVRQSQAAATDLSKTKERDMKIYLTQEVWVKRELVSREARALLGGFLTRDVNRRLGCVGTMASALQGVKDNAWFGSIDWESLAKEEMAAPYLPRRAVNAKDESEMKTFNTAGMKSLTAEDEDRWAEWDWTSRDHQADELADWLYGQLDTDDKRRTKKGPPEVGGCCAVQ